MTDDQPETAGADPEAGSPPEAAEPDHDHEHDRDGEHDDDEHEHEVDEQRLRTLAAALGNLDDTAIRRAVAAMREQTRVEAAEQLQLSKATMHLGDALPPMLRRKALAASPARQLTIAFALTEAVNEDTISVLGERHDDPSRADLDAVLPDLIEDHGAPLVALMVAAYACSDARCQEVMADLADTDERLAVPELSEDALELTEVGGVTTFTRDADDPAQVAKREQRKAAKAAKREAASRQRGAEAAAQSARRDALHRAKRSRTRKP